MFIKQMKELEILVDNMRKHGKSEQEIQTRVGLYLTESKKKINPDGELDII